MISMKEISIIIFYSVSIFMFLNMNSLMLFWLMLEINMILFIILMSTTEKNAINQILFYFMVQTLGSLIFLMSMIMMEESNKFLSNIMISGSVFLKMGLSPFHQWLFKISTQLSKFNFVILITIQKIPFFWLMTQMINDIMVTVIYFSMVIGAFLIFKSTSIKEMLISSSIYMTTWIWLTSMMSLYYFMMFYMIYTLMNAILLDMTSGGSGISTQSKEIEWNFLLMFFIGLPPMSMFYMKIYGFGYLNNISSVTLEFILWTSGFTATMGYMKMLLKSMNKTLKEKKSIKNSTVVDMTMMAPTMMYISLLLML